MKAKLFFSIGLAIFFVLQQTPSFGQDTSLVRSLPPVTVTAKTKKIPPAVWKGFSGYFTEAENPGWYEVNKRYLVKFMIYDKANRALFTKRGKMIYHISYGYENSLPENISVLVKASYADYDITRAIKINEAGREVWVINLQDSKSLVMVSIEDGEMQEIQRFKRSS